VTEDAISIGGVDLADPDTYMSGMPFDAFRKLRECAPVAWHPYKDGPGNHAEQSGIRRSEKCRHLCRRQRHVAPASDVGSGRCPNVTGLSARLSPRATSNLSICDA